MRPMKGLLVLCLLGLCAGVEQADCEQQTTPQAVYTRGSQSRTIETPPETDNRGFAFNLAPGEEIDRIKLGPQKVLCLYSEPPNAPQLFEHDPTHKHIVGLDDVPVTTETHYEVVCTNGSTLPSVVEDLETRIGDPAEDDLPFEAVFGRVEDIGECSGRVQTDVLYSFFKREYDAQLEGRYGENRTPEGRDFIGPYDFAVGIKPPNPDVGPWVFYDYNPAGLEDGWNEVASNVHYGAPGEIGLRFRARVDGDLHWEPDPDWIGNGNRPGLSKFVSGVLTAGIGIVFFPAFFFADCEKDRHMLVTMRGALEAAHDGGIGIRFEPFPKSWAGLQQWPAINAICNNQIKPMIQSQFVQNTLAATVTPEGEVISQTTTEDGTGSSLPFRRFDFTPIPIRRVVVTDRFAHAIFCETRTDCPDDLYEELRDRGECALDRNLHDPLPTPLTLTHGGF